MGASPDLEIDSVVRWRRIDPKQVIEKHFGVAYRERYVGKLLQELGFSHLSGRPRHPAQDGQIIEHIEKIFPRTLGAHLAGVTRKKKIEIWFQCMVRLRLARRNDSPDRPCLSVSGFFRGRSRPSHNGSRWDAFLTRRPDLLIYCHHQVSARGRNRSSIYWNHQAARPIRCTAPLHSPRKSFGQSPHAAVGRNDVFCVRTAQMIRAALLALATTILLVCIPRSPRRSMNAVTPFSRFLRL